MIRSEDQGFHITQMRVDLRIVSGKTLDTNPSFFISFEDGIYLFNVPDQTQRLFMQHKWKMIKIKQICLTSLGPEAIGGLMGLTLTTNGGKENTFGLVSPNDLGECLLKTPLYEDQGQLPQICSSYEDSNLKIDSIQMSKSLSYIVQICEIPGKFLPNRAKELGIKPGPSFKILQSGQSITLDNGIVVRPEDCIEPPRPGPRILVVDCRSLSDLDILNFNMNDFSMIIHFTDPSLLNTQEYLAKFPDNMQNICFMPSGRLSFRPIAEMYSNFVSENLATDLDTPAPLNYISGHTLTSFVLVPLCTSLYGTCPNKESIKFNPELPKFETFALTFLGTGSKNPSKFRNVPGILVHCRGGYIVLDAGEGFYGQLMRKFGPENTKSIISNIKLIWISHNHGDHVFGLHQLLSERAKLCDDIIPLCADEDVIEELRYKESISFNFNVDYYDRSKNIIEGESFTLKAIPVKHNEGAHGCLLTIDDSYRVAYSGDRCQDDDFVAQVGNCDLLIHEATFSDSMKEFADQVCHSTISGAIETGKALNAKFIALTHISQRYSNESISIKDESEIGIIITFDYLSFAFEHASEICELSQKAFASILTAENKED